MTNSTTEFWDVDGVSLNRFAWSIQSFGGSRWGLPPLRGDDQQYAYMPGMSPRERIPDSRMIVLRMFVLGIDPSTDAYVANPRVQFNENWRYLQRLFFHPDKEFVLTRRWETASGMNSASTMARQVGLMDPEMTGRMRATFDVELLLADPFFYGSPITRTMNAGSSITIEYGGDYKTTTARDMTIEINGSISNPKITNSSTSPQNWFQVGSDIAAGDSVVVDIEHATVIRQSDGVSLIGGLTHSGSRRFLLMQPGTNQLLLTGTVGAGTATITYREAYV